MPKTKNGKDVVQIKSRVPPRRLVLVKEGIRVPRDGDCRDWCRHHSFGADGDRERLDLVEWRAELDGGCSPGGDTVLFGPRLEHLDVRKREGTELGGRRQDGLPLFHQLC